MTNIFFKTPVPACDKNETDACASVPLITCENTNDLVLYVLQDDEPSVTLDDNCIIIKGNELDLVKAVDRLLFAFYEI